MTLIFGIPFALVVVAFYFLVGKRRGIIPVTEVAQVAGSESTRA